MMWTSGCLGFLVILAVVTCKDLCPDNCQCDSSRGVVNCRNAGLTRFPAELPDNVNIREIDLRDNDIRELISGVVSYPNLELLDLSGNRLVSIDDRVFEALPKLKSLYLQNNDLPLLTEYTFTGLGSLKVLDISHNQIRILKDRVFADLVAMEDLILVGNGVDQIREDTFEGLRELHTLDLSDNRLVNIPAIALKKMPRLTKVYLKENQLESIPTHAFSTMKDLYELRLDGNHISRISETAFSDHERRDTPYLSVLSLRGNRIKKVPSEVLSQLSTLVSIDLSENPISVVDPDAFKGLSHLRSIFLNSLPLLKAVRSFAFSELDNLQSIEMHSNRELHDIADDAFVGSSKLRKIDLHANQLLSVSANLFEWDKLESIDLRYNPWNCDCHLKWLPKVLSSVSTNISRHLTQDVRCEHPENLASCHIYQLSSSDMTCPNPEDEFEERILIAITAGISVVLLIIMLYLLYKHDYCGLKGKRAPSTPAYHAHTNCNGHVPARNDEERLNIADHEQQANGDNFV